PSVGNVCGADRDHHAERWDNERYADQGGAKNSVMNVSEVHRQLRSERTRHQLRQREPFFVIRLRNPTTSIDEIAVHVTDQRDRTAETQSPELQYVHDELPQGITWPR